MGSPGGGGSSSRRRGTVTWVKASLSKTVDDRRQGCDRLRAFAAGVVHEDDRPGMGAGEGALDDRVHARSGEVSVSVDQSTISRCSARSSLKVVASKDP